MSDELGEDEEPIEQGRAEVDRNDSHENKSDHFPELTEQELQTAIDWLKRGKAGDTKGIKAEDLKGCDDEAKEMMRSIFNEIITQESKAPNFWRKLVIKSDLHKTVMRQDQIITVQFAHCRPKTFVDATLQALQQA